MKKIVSVILVAVLMFACATVAFTQEKDEATAIVFDSFSGEIIEENVAFDISENEVSFTIQKQSYMFPLEKIEMESADQDAQLYIGSNGDLSCSVVEYGGQYCVQVLNTSQSKAGRAEDKEGNFTLVYGTLSESDLDEILDTINGN